MITLFHFIRLALLNLRRGGQRVIAALLCIIFGIMALVAMNMLAQSISSAIQVTPAELLGGDISMGREVEDTLRSVDIAQLKSLQQSGEISRYTLIAFRSGVMFHAPASGEMHFAGSGLGIEPDNYPLAGSLTILEPGSIGLPTLLQKSGDVVLTRDLAEEYDYQVGDAIVLADPTIGVPVNGTVRGIASDTPNHRGDKIYYSIDTAQQIAGGQPVVNTVMVNTNQPPALIEKLKNSGWAVDWAAGRRDDQVANMWVMGLRGAGILGLLVSGIGIANTMQVLLRRRQREIAIWKTLGYREGHLRLIFTLEAGLLGLAGSLVGAGLGVAISTGLLELFRRTSTLLYAWTFSPTPPLLGILVGTLTTVIFAAWAIVVSSQARPMSLLRSEPVAVRSLPGCQSILLALILAAPFTALTSLVMGSVIAGIGVLIAIVSGIGMLGGFFGAALWACAHLLPLRGFPLARMALNSLRRRGVALVFAMIALFVGIVSMSMGLVVMQFSGRIITGGETSFQSYNLDVLGPADQESTIRQAIEAQHPQKLSVGYRTALTSLSAAGEPLAATDAALVGRSDPEDYVISGAAWGSQPGGVYVHKWANLKVGSPVEVTFRDGTTRTFTVVGTYEVNFRSVNLYPPLGLLIPADDFTRATRPDTVTYFAQVDPNQLVSAAGALGAALPQATVVNLVAYAGRFMHAYQNLYTLPIVLAALALLAGFLLVANSVSLAMLDRRYEIGILKTVGYTRRQILTIFAVEYGLVGLLATAAGVLIVQGMLAVVAFGNHLSPSALLLNIPSLTVIAICGVGLTLLTVFTVTWNPTGVSPVVVLNEGNG